MKTEQLMREFKAINQRITRLETTLKKLMYSQYNESISKIDYLAMMEDIDLNIEEEENGSI